MKSKLISTAVLLCWLAGCLFGCRVVAYHGPDGGRLYLGNVGFDTQIGTLNVEKGAQGTRVGLEGYKSDATRSLELANKLADKVR